jgi:hypothetical protein
MIEGKVFDAQNVKLEFNIKTDLDKLVRRPKTNRKERERDHEIHREEGSGKDDSTHRGKRNREPKKKGSTEQTKERGKGERDEQASGPTASSFDPHAASKPSPFASSIGALCGLGCRASCTDP